MNAVILMLLPLFAIEFLSVPELHVLTYEGGKLLSESALSTLGLDYRMSVQHDVEKVNVFVERSRGSGSEFIIRFPDDTMLLDLSDLLLQAFEGSRLSLAAYADLHSAGADSLFSREASSPPDTLSPLSVPTQTQKSPLLLENSESLEALYWRVDHALILAVEALSIVVIAVHP